MASLPEAEVRKDRPAAYFGSIHGTLNHILVIDRLHLTLYEDFPALHDARQAEDRRIVDLIDGLDEASVTVSTILPMA